MLQVDALRRALQETGKSFANRAAKAPNKKSATAVAEEGCTTLQQIFSKGSGNIEALKTMGKQLRGLPFVDPETPTVALVGAPNVGKSSLVKILSSGTPEVCNYPFTTRSIKMGHFYIHEKKHQVGKGGSDWYGGAWVRSEGWGGGGGRERGRGKRRSWNMGIYKDGAYVKKYQMGEGEGRGRAGGRWGRL